MCNIYAPNFQWIAPQKLANEKYEFFDPPTRVSHLGGTLCLLRGTCQPPGRY